jgi:hypothetical protein
MSSLGKLQDVSTFMIAFLRKDALEFFQHLVTFLGCQFLSAFLSVLEPHSEFHG